MRRKSIYLISFVLALALVGTNVMFGGTVIERQVNKSSDDSEEQDPSGNMRNAEDGNLEMPYEDQGTPPSDKQMVGIRFEDITIPQGSAISDAWVRFDVDNTKNGTDPVSLIIAGELNPNAVTFGNNDFDISGRPRTTAQVVWVPDNWTATHTKHLTSNIAPVIEEIVNQDGWQTNNALVLIISDNPANPSGGIRCAESWNGAGSNVDRIPLLHIEFTSKRTVQPNPADGALHLDTRVRLSWVPGVTAISHNVYFGESFADVNDGTGGTSVGSSTGAYYDIGAGMPGDPYPGGLVPGTTYYWRIDEVEADGITIHKGDVWSFMIPLRIAYNPDPPDGAEYVDTNVVLNWSAGLHANMRRVYFGESIADVNAGTGDTARGLVVATNYTPGPLAKDTTYYWRIDESSRWAINKGDVWQFTTRPFIPIDDPNLVGWWKFDGDVPGIVVDSSGYDRYGTLRGDPQFVAGYDGDALELDGDDWVNIDGYKGILRISANVQHAFTCAAWIKTSGNGSIIGWGRSSGRQRVEFRVNGGRLRCEHGGGNVQGDTNVLDNEWHYVALTVKENATISYPDVKLYLDGQDDTRNTTDPDAFNLTSNFDVKIGQRYNDTSTRWFTGLIDDVRIYAKELTPAEIAEMLKGYTELASAPSPANRTTVDIGRATPLRWSPGEKAAEHDVYFGTDLGAVVNADTSDTSGIYRGRQNLGNESYYYRPEAFEFGQTYYWRIDELNTDATIGKGKIWRFTLGNYLVVDDFEDYNDYEPDRIFDTWVDGWGVATNGSVVGYEEPDFTLGEHFVETAIVHGGSQSMPYFYDNDFKYSQASMTLSSQRDWTIRGVGVLSLWFRGYPASFSSFTQAPAGTYTMTARCGDIWGQTDELHYVYKQLSGVGSIVAKVENVTYTSAGAKAGVMIRETLEADSKHAFTFMRPDGGVRFNRRVDVGGGTTNSVENGLDFPHWVRLERNVAGDFTAAHSTDGINWVPVDDLVDGSTANVQMTANVYIGLALSSNNTGATCEAVFSNVRTTGAVSPQWVSQNIGILSNDPESMYVVVSNSTGTPAVVYHDDPAATQVGTWTEWNIDLKQLADQGINLTNVDKFSIGFGGKNNMQAGSSGLVYFDDIRLYPLPEPQADSAGN